jgi:isopentenyl-diphosphate delta-isomerase
LGELLAEWGIPTLASVALASRSGLPVIATGGVRNGLHAAKAIAMGATAVGVARPLLEAALASDEAVDRWVADFRSGLVAAMYLTGSPDLAALRVTSRVIHGALRDWMSLDGGPEHG